MISDLSFLSAVSITPSGIVLCTLASLVTGIIIASVYTFRHTANKNFVITLALLPVIIQSVIMMVNGNIGTGVAVMGAFSLVRFRSVPGTSKEITSIFLAMSVGLATGTGHLVYALIFTLVICGMIVLFSIVKFGEAKTNMRVLKVVIPEDLDYTVIFEDVFLEFSRKTVLEKVRTINLGSLYELHYTVFLKNTTQEKELLDAIRQRNSNLDISCSKVLANREEL